MMFFGNVPAVVVFAEQDVVRVGSAAAPLDPTRRGNDASEVRVLEDNSSIVPTWTRVSLGTASRH